MTVRSRKTTPQLAAKQCAQSLGDPLTQPLASRPAAAVPLPAPAAAAAAAARPERLGAWCAAVTNRPQPGVHNQQAGTG